MNNMVCPTCGLLPSPGRLAFHHRHVALAYVRKAAPDLHSEAVGHAYAETEGRGLTFDDYVARLEAVAEAARAWDAAQREYERWHDDPSRAASDGEGIVTEMDAAHAAMRFALEAL